MVCVQRETAQDVVPAFPKLPAMGLTGTDPSERLHICSEDRLVEKLLPNSLVN